MSNKFSVDVDGEIPVVGLGVAHGGSVTSIIGKFKNTKFYPNYYVASACMALKSPSLVR